MAKIMYMGNEVQVIGYGAGGGGSSFEKVLENGVISQSSGSYDIATFNDISSRKYVIVKVFDTVSGVDYFGYAMLNISNIVANGYIDFIVYAHLPITCRITTTSIQAIQYGGNWEDIYANVAVSDDDNII